MVDLCRFLNTSWPLLLNSGQDYGKFKTHKTKAANIELGKSRPNKNFVHCLLGSCFQTKQLICRHRFHLFNNRKIISVFSESDTNIVQWTSVNMWNYKFTATQEIISIYSEFQLIKENRITMLYFNYLTHMHAWFLHITK